MKPEPWKRCPCGHVFMFHDGDGDDEDLTCCVDECNCVVPVGQAVLPLELTPRLNPDPVPPILGR